MNGRRQDARAFAARPRSADAWITATESGASQSRRTANTARLTIDVTPQLRQRLKLAALQRGTTLADLVRDLLVQAFPDDDQGSAP